MRQETGEGDEAHAGQDLRQAFVCDAIY